MKRRIKALFLCLTIAAVSLAGCGQKHKTMETPDDGWTMKELLSVTYLCDNQLSYPLTVESLIKDFSVDKDVMKIGDHLVTDMNYQGKYFAPCIFGTDKNTEQSLEYFLSFVVDKPDNAKGFSFSINGIGFDSSKEEICSALGEPDDQNVTAGSFTYHDREDRSRQLHIIFDGNYPMEFSFAC